MGDTDFMYPSLVLSDDNLESEEVREKQAEKISEKETAS